MLKRPVSLPKTALASATQCLHVQSAIYTSDYVAGKLLDLVAWTSTTNLTQATLLEPGVGEGAILLEAMRRLVSSYRRQGLPLTLSSLKDRIIGFEIHGPTAISTREKICSYLESQGVSKRTAQKVGIAWLRHDDYLLTPVLTATHIVANPPYLRWSKVPKMLAASYERTLRSIVVGGDISLTFLDQMLKWLQQDGVISTIITDRWLFAQYGSAFLRDCKDNDWNIEIIDERPQNAYVRNIGAYPSIIRISRSIETTATKHLKLSSRANFRQLHEKLIARHGTLGTAGCIVRVGPALGAGRTFILSSEHFTGIEESLLRPFIDRNALSGDHEAAGRKLVVCPYDHQGKLIKLTDWPGFSRWADRHKDVLKNRTCVMDGNKWWKTIDVIGSQWDISPKLLIPELCIVPKVSLDQTGGIPAHSIYAIWPGDWPAPTLQRVLNSGLLYLTASAESPRIENGWFRFYKKFILKTPLPNWHCLSEEQRKGLQSINEDRFSKHYFSLFGFLPGELNENSVFPTP